MCSFFFLLYYIFFYINNNIYATKVASQLSCMELNARIYPHPSSTLSSSPTTVGSAATGERHDAALASFQQLFKYCSTDKQLHTVRLLNDAVIEYGNCEVANKKKEATITNDDNNNNNNINESIIIQHHINWAMRLLKQMLFGREHHNQQQQQLEQMDDHPDDGEEYGVIELTDPAFVGMSVNRVPLMGVDLFGLLVKYCYLDCYHLAQTTVDNSLDLASAIVHALKERLSNESSSGRSVVAYYLRIARVFSMAATLQAVMQLNVENGRQVDQVPERDQGSISKYISFMC